MRSYFNAIVNVPVSDPEDSRRRRLLNILMLGTFIASLCGLAVVLIDSITSKNLSSTDRQLFIEGIIFVTVGTSFIYLINRRVSGKWAALLYLLLVTLIFTFSDEPQQLADGRSLFIYTIPIAISSLILFPAASFIFAALSSSIIVLLAQSVGTVPNPVAIIGFFMLALVSWLSARSLDQALVELRAINANLDRAVTERTQALAESLERERIEAGRNQAILNSIADGVVVFDPKWNAILANPALRGMLDLPLESIVNRNFRELIENPQVPPKSRSLLNAMMEHDTQPPSFRIEWGEKTLSISAAQVYDNSKQWNTNIGTVTVFRDFTHEAELEKLKSTFVAIVSHELRTPLNAILGYAEMFKEAVYGPMNKKQINMAARIIINTERLLGLINDLLDQAQMEAGKLTIKMAPIRPADLLENILGIMDPIVQAKGLELTSEIEEDLPEILSGDGARLQQILVNLINNGAKFTDQGTVHIRLFRPSMSKWGIEVSDTGRGIPDSEVPYIFDTFRQVEGAATRVHGGIGLGLSIVRQLVLLMHGEIRVKSIVDKGSTFTITLPLVLVEETMEKGAMNE
jgi:signal transduction histidine kinase